MLMTVVSGLLLGGWVVPSGLDFSVYPVDEVRLRFDVWVTVHAANGDTFDYGRWKMFGGSGCRADYKEAIIDPLVNGGCKVEQRGDVVAVRTLNGSPVVSVTVKSVGPGPTVVWVDRAPDVKPKK